MLARVSLCVSWPLHTQLWYKLGCCAVVGIFVFGCVGDGIVIWKSSFKYFFHSSILYFKDYINELLFTREVFGELEIEGKTMA